MVERKVMSMDEPKAWPYETRLDILYGPLQVIDEKSLADACSHKWYNQTLCKVNGSVVRMGVVQGEYHWHKHDDDDEFFYVVEGKLFIDLTERTVELAARQGFVVPRGVTHRTRADERTVILMVENAGIIPTGN
jgi:mannose-6-phosphate isomerase-like protein (cupin superfamily)